MVFKTCADVWNSLDIELREQILLMIPFNIKFVNVSCSFDEIHHEYKDIVKSTIKLSTPESKGIYFLD